MALLGFKLLFVMGSRILNLRGLEQLLGFGLVGAEVGSYGFTRIIFENSILVNITCFFRHPVVHCCICVNVGMHARDE